MPPAQTGQKEYHKNKTSQAFKTHLIYNVNMSLNPKVAFGVVFLFLISFLRPYFFSCLLGADRWCFKYSLGFQYAREEFLVQLTALQATHWWKCWRKDNCCEICCFWCQALDCKQVVEKCRFWDFSTDMFPQQLSFWMWSFGFSCRISPASL